MPSAVLRNISKAIPGFQESILRSVGKSPISSEVTDSVVQESNVVPFPRVVPPFEEDTTQDTTSTANLITNNNVHNMQSLLVKIQQGLIKHHENTIQELKATARGLQPSNDNSVEVAKADLVQQSYPTMTTAARALLLVLDKLDFAYRGKGSSEPEIDYGNPSTERASINTVPADKQSSGLGVLGALGLGALGLGLLGKSTQPADTPSDKENQPSSSPAQPNQETPINRNLPPAGSSEHATQAMEYFMSQGWTKEQAAGIVGNLQVESFKQLDPNASLTDSTGNTWGIAQWRGDRQRGKFVKQALGVDTVVGTTFEQQLSYVQWELTHRYKNAGDALRKVKTAEEAAIIIENQYEVAGGSAMSQRIANANFLVSSEGQSTSAAGAVGAAVAAGTKQFEVVKAMAFKTALQIFVVDKSKAKNKFPNNILINQKTNKPYTGFLSTKHRNKVNAMMDRLRKSRGRTRLFNRDNAPTSIDLNVGGLVITVGVEKLYNMIFTIDVGLTKGKAQRTHDGQSGLIVCVPNMDAINAALENSTQKMAPDLQAQAQSMMSTMMDFVGSIFGFSSNKIIMPTSGTYTGQFHDPRKGHLHQGIDIANSQGTPIVAALDGTVTRVGVGSGGAGNRIRIKHAGGFETVYMHLSSFNVQQGTTVRQGQKIGEMGNTGASTGTHLHFEIYKNGVAQNPAEYLGLPNKGGHVDSKAAGSNIPQSSSQSTAPTRQTRKPVPDQKKRSTKMERSKQKKKPIVVQQTAGWGSAQPAVVSSRGSSRKSANAGTGLTRELYAEALVELPISTA